MPQSRMLGFTPRLVNPEVVKALVNQGEIYFDPENGSAKWFDSFFTFSPGQTICFGPLWRNLLRGNGPIPQERVLLGWHGDSTNVSDLFKRHAIWRTVIVGDGRGRLWLNVPEEHCLSIRY